MVHKPLNRVFGDEGAEISDPFIAYSDIIKSLTEQNEMGYTLDIGILNNSHILYKKKFSERYVLPKRHARFYA